MVAAVRAGLSLRAVAKAFRVSACTVYRWVARAAGRRLDRVDWSGRSSAPHRQARQTDPQTEELVLAARKRLQADSDLGEYGAEAIRRDLQQSGQSPLPSVPSVRTIGRILARTGALDAGHRVRHKPPPRGWYLPEVASRQAEMDEWDIVEGLVIRDGPSVEVLNVVSVHGGLVGSWPESAILTEHVRAALLSHWQALGLPDYAQFDNGSSFAGTHRHPDAIGSVTRLCLRLGVVVVFAPPRETGFQAAIESYNGRWEEKVWRRFEHRSLPALQEQSTRYVAASRQRNVVRLESAPCRRPFPADDQWQATGPLPRRGRIIFLRRTSETGQVRLLGRDFLVDAQWPRRLVRCELSIEEDLIRCHRLRRREPADQPLACEIPYELPNRMLHG